MIASSSISRPTASSSAARGNHDRACMARSKLRGREGHCACTLRKTGNEVGGKESEARMVSSPAYSPCAPELGCNEKAS